MLVKTLYAGVAFCSGDRKCHCASLYNCGSDYLLCPQARAKLQPPNFQALTVSVPSIDALLVNATQSFFYRRHRMILEPVACGWTTLTVSKLAPRFSLSGLAIRKPWEATSALLGCAMRQWSSSERAMPFRKVAYAFPPKKRTSSSNTTRAPLYSPHSMCE